jgi:CRP-like cAMP-binding protein
MVSPELLRRYPFFCCLDDAQLKALAMIGQESEFEQGAMLFQEGEPARQLWLLMNGSVDLYYQTDANRGEPLLVGQINPGEVFAISALIEPYRLTSSARAGEDCRALCFDGSALRALCEVDCKLGYLLMRQLAASAIERLNFTRVELAAARVTMLPA